MMGYSLNCYTICNFESLLSTFIYDYIKVFQMCVTRLPLFTPISLTNNLSPASEASREVAKYIQDTKHKQTKNIDLSCTISR